MPWAPQLSPGEGSQIPGEPEEEAGLRGGAPPQRLPSKHTLILFHRQAPFWLQLKPSYSDNSPVYSTDKPQKTKQG